MRGWRIGGGSDARGPAYSRHCACRSSLGFAHCPALSAIDLAVSTLELSSASAANDAAATQRIAHLESLVADLSSELSWASTRLVSEIYDRSALEANAARLERNDPATGLPNRRALEERLPQALAAHAASGEPAALVALGLAHLPAIRQSLGCAAGDRVLRVAADRLRRTLRGSDLIARVGEQDFALLLTHLRDASDAELVARKLFDALDAPVAHDSRDLPLRPAIGVALYPRDGDSAELLLARADAACRHALEHGGALLRFFEPDLTARATHRLTLEADLRAALERDQLRVLYQPRFDARSGRLAGAEALARWQHPSRGLLAPADFLEVAECTGLIVPIGERVLRSACRTAAGWTHAAPRAQRPVVSVNLSPREFRGRSLPARVAQALAEAELPAEQLQVELTESGIESAGEQAQAAIAELRALGVKVALDGFGSGSLMLLRRLPADCVKIDGELIRRAPHDKCDALVVSAVAGLGRRLGLRVVAAGVETEPQLALARKLRCHEVQGYLLGEPMAAERLTDWLQAQGKRSRRR